MEDVNNGVPFTVSFSSFSGFPFDLVLRSLEESSASAFLKNSSLNNLFSEAIDEFIFGFVVYDIDMYVVTGIFDGKCRVRDC
jgi:hypothetical protein